MKSFFSSRFSYLATVLFCVALLPTSAIADCPDTTFKCPNTGHNFTMGSSFQWSSFQCETNSSLVDKAVNDCQPNLCDGQWRGRADGCSIPVPGLNETWNQVFHGACDLHDLCYASPGHSQAQCDQWFLDNMLATCNLPGLGSALRSLCADSAGIIYTAVALAGGPSFEGGQNFAKDHCTYDYSGEHRIQVKASSRFLHLDGNGDKLLSTRYQPSDDFTRFIFQRQGDGSYRIMVKATGTYLHEDGNGDKIVSTRYQPGDDFTRFFLEQQSDGSVRIKVKASNRYFHEDGNGDKIVSTRYQPTDDFTHFYLR